MTRFGILAYWDLYAATLTRPPLTHTVTVTRTVEEPMPAPPLASATLDA